MEKLETIGYSAIIIVIFVSVLFIGIEIGKYWSVRNTVTSAVTSIDPWLYCDIHARLNYTRDYIGDDIEHYASELYIIMSAENILDCEPGEC